MTTSVHVIADSISEEGIRLTSLECYYPWIIHAEVLRHRALAQSVSSSRAIPVRKMIAAIKRDPYIPIHWGKNEPGMVAHQEHDERVRLPSVPGRSFDRRAAWIIGLNRALEMAEAFDAAGYHKQIVNRLLLPYAHVRTIVTATEWTNFLKLRDHPDAQPEIRELAVAIRAALGRHRPEKLRADVWHLPYVSEDERLELGSHRALAVSTARCARVSYRTHDLRPSTVEEDLALHDRLLTADPVHASPAEHQALADYRTPTLDGWCFPQQHGPFYGWRQYRKACFPGEAGGTRAAVYDVRL